MNNKLYEKLIRNIGYCLKSILDEDILNFDVTEYEDDKSDIISSSDISDIIKITSPDDLREEVVIFEDKILDVLKELRIGLSKKIKSMHAKKIIDALMPCIYIYNGVIIDDENRYFNTDYDEFITDYSLFRKSKLTKYRNYDILKLFNCFMYAIVNNNNYKQYFDWKVEKYEDGYIKYATDPYSNFRNSKYEMTLFVVDIAYDSSEFNSKRYDYEGLCNLMDVYINHIKGRNNIHLIDKSLIIYI